MRASDLSMLVCPYNPGAVDKVGFEQAQHTPCAAMPKQELCYCNAARQEMIGASCCLPQQLAEFEPGRCEQTQGLCSKLMYPEA